MEDRPKSLKFREYQQARLSMLGEPHVAPLTEYVTALRGLGRGEVPYFDPLDGGINAKILFVLQNPGKRTLVGITPPRKTPGSGFISRNNDDETAKNLFELLAEAGIPREASLIWNIVPWYNEKNVDDQIGPGAFELQKLMSMLGRLKVVIAVGEKAWAGLRYVRIPDGVELRKSAHTSPQVINKWPHKRGEILRDWRQSYALALSRP